MNKTAWAYFGCKNPEGVLQRAKAQKVNVLRVALEGTPYFEELNLDLFPWGGTRESPQWQTWNEEYWKEVKRRIELAGEQGIGFDLCLYFTVHPREDEIERQKLYWGKILRELSSYTNILTWEITNEYTENETFQDAVGRFFREWDPHHRPVCTSNGTTDDAVWPQKDWMDLAIVHTCTGSSPEYDLEDWYLSIARHVRSYGKPAFNNGSGREKGHGNDDGVHRRKQGWLWCMAGAYWTWHSWDGCEGIDTVDDQAPGAESVRPRVEFFESLPFWAMNPNYTVCTIKHPNLVSTTLADPERNLVVSYCCTKESDAVAKEIQVTLILPQGNYSIEFMNPLNLERVGKMQWASEGYHQRDTIPLPTFTDDLVIRIEKVR